MKARRVLLGGEKFHWSDGFINEDGRSKRSPVDRTCINIQTVWALVRDAFLGRCVPVANETAEVLGARQKRLPNPEEVMLVLLIERSVGVNACVDEEAHAVVVRFRKRSQPLYMLPRNIDGAWGVEGGLAISRVLREKTIILRKRFWHRPSIKINTRDNEYDDERPSNGDRFAAHSEGGGATHEPERILAGQTPPRWRRPDLHQNGRRRPL
jgi:hypothetical protein